MMTRSEKDAELTVTLMERGSASGKITAVEKNGPDDDPQEVYIQFLDFENNFRHDDEGLHNISIKRSEDGEWERAHFKYSWTDTGRVRQEHIDDVSWVLPRLNRYIATNLEKSEQRILSLLDIGYSEQEAAEIWGCEDSDIQNVLKNIRHMYNLSKKTVNALESYSINIENPGVGAGTNDWRAFGRC